MTVSNVLDDGGRVGDATRKRGLRSTSALNYVPNVATARFAVRSCRGLACCIRVSSPSSSTRW
ncbi:hypothetical protein [Brevundimonas vesicularis]|uniref:hypothetical protein n=1 Tax=Brevundimonas vesicularis TaxID=41276 RepID=UPI00384C8E59